MRVTSKRRIKLEHVAVWRRVDGVFLGSVDEGCSFIIELKGAARDKVLAVFEAEEAIITWGKQFCPDLAGKELREAYAAQQAAEDAEDDALTA